MPVSLKQEKRPLYQVEPAASAPTLAVPGTPRASSVPPSASPMGPIAGNAAKLMDVLLLSFSLIFAVGAYFLEAPAHSIRELLAMQVSVHDLAFALIGWCFWGVCLWSTGIYRGSKGRTTRQLYTQTFTGTTLCTVVTGILLLPHHHGASLIQPLLYFWASSCALLLASRALRMVYLNRVRPRFREQRKALIVGSGPRAQQLAIEIASHGTFDYELIGFVDSNPQPGPDQSPLPLMGSIEDLEDILMHQQVDDVFVALPMRSQYQQIERVLSLCEQTGVQSQYLADLFATSVTKRRIAEGQDADRIVLQMVHHDGRRHIKRTVDLVGAALGLVVLSPVFLAVAILIKLSSPGPVFFSQIRFGLNKRRFPMYKFRSMVPDAETLQAALEDRNESAGPVFKIKNDPRITPIGRFIRKTSIDELPQLLNVLLGQMSLVGPRPLPMRDVSRFSEASLMRRFSVKPGMTGLWQVSGRSNTSFSGWISLDLHYIDHWSLGMDTRILLRTISVVMRGTGAS